MALILISCALSNLSVFPAHGQALLIEMQGHRQSRGLLSERRESTGSVVAVRRSGGRAVERRTVNRGDGGSIPPTAVSKLRQFRSPHIAYVFRKRH